MKEKLSHWALQFKILYNKGTHNADALSWQSCTTVTKIICGPSESELIKEQANDPILAKIISYLKTNSNKKKTSRYRMETPTIQKVASTMAPTQVIEWCSLSYH